VALEVSDGARAIEVLRGFSGTTHVRCDGSWLVVEGSALRPVDLFTALDHAGVEIRGFHKGRTLEAAYVALVNGAKSDHHSPDPAPTFS
jgi:hypothetical protein